MLSVILLSYYSNSRLITVYEKLNGELSKNNIPFELIIIDDGSLDNSFDIATRLAEERTNVQAYRLSKNFTSHYAIFAGLTKAAGSCVTVIPDDEQQPYETLVSMYQAWEGGSKIVIPHRVSRGDSFFSKSFSQVFYRLMNRFSEVHFPIGGADSFLIDREIVDILNTRIHPINTTSITEILRLGFEPTLLAYYRPRGNNQKSRWTVKKKINLAKDFFFSSSNFPIKVIFNLGLFFSVFSVLIILIYTYAKFFGNSEFWRLTEVPGWTSIIVIISFFSGLILFSLGIIAEYIWRIYEEVKNRPGYIIRK